MLPSQTQASPGPAQEAALSAVPQLQMPVPALQPLAHHAAAGCLPQWAPGAGAVALLAVALKALLRLCRHQWPWEPPAEPLLPAVPGPWAPAAARWAPAGSQAHHSQAHGAPARLQHAVGAEEPEPPDEHGTLPAAAAAAAAVLAAVVAPAARAAAAAALAAAAPAAAAGRDSWARDGAWGPHPAPVSLSNQCPWQGLSLVVRVGEPLGKQRAPQQRLSGLARVLAPPHAWLHAWLEAQLTWSQLGKQLPWALAGQAKAVAEELGLKAPLQRAWQQLCLPQPLWPWAGCSEVHCESPALARAHGLPLPWLLLRQQLQPGQAGCCCCSRQVPAGHAPRSSVPGCPEPRGASRGAVHAHANPHAHGPAHAHACGLSAGRAWVGRGPAWWAG